MILDQYIVGQRFPYDRAAQEEGSRPILTQGWFNVVITLHNIDPREQAAFEQDKIYYGLKSYRDIPVFVIRIGMLWHQEVLLNIHGIDDSAEKDNWMAHDSNVMALFLVEQGDLIIKAIRLVTVDESTVSELKKILQKQRTAYPTFYMVDKGCQNYLATHSIAETIEGMDWHDVS